MVLFIILGVIILIAVAVLGILFFMLGKEGKKEEQNAVPLTDLAQLRMELSTGFLEPQRPKPAVNESEIIPPYEPKMPIGPSSSPSQGPLQAPGEVKQLSLEEMAYKKRAKDLEDELRDISQKADGQSDEAKKMIETLTKENETLKSQKADMEQAQQKLIALQDEASGLKTQNVSLQTQLELTDAKVHFLEEEMAAVKLQMGEEISRANAMVSELKNEKEAVSPALKPDPDEILRLELESLRSEQFQLKHKNEDLERTQQKLRELNTHLIEKNELLQYELIKARAQSSGLERVSYNYKNQLEDFLKKVNAVQVSNDQLSQVKNRLEGMVQEVKSQNEELLKKDQLARSELENKRLQLASLEREYENLKARVQQKNQ